MMPTAVAFLAVQTAEKLSLSIHQLVLALAKSPFPFTANPTHH